MAGWRRGIRQGLRLLPRGERRAGAEGARVAGGVHRAGGAIGQPGDAGVPAERDRRCDARRCGAAHQRRSRGRTGVSRHGQAGIPEGCAGRRGARGDAVCGDGESFCAGRGAAAGDGGRAGGVARGLGDCARARGGDGCAAGFGERARAG
ncbi:hypothetical protein ebB190 [Aromatoleum aromaticum EbN1]|uniref:Uncharacterized protein n=1 Tax=Aromatoleum aromaticum (strain DSM 19018 / LMG 30748 / EbN1) TaxID=76114 RepID=Q5P0I8_AROAE|nr:hypothetical protein ebB190 [Aromatoleum aromaticum EbN1]